MNIVFMGTPDFARKSLEEIIKSKKINIKAVITNPDKPKGRGKVLTPSPVKELALKHNLRVLQPEKIKDNTQLIGELQSFDLDLLVVVAYGKILPKEILNIPKKGAINLHASLLPKYRGAAPIQWAIINGEKTTGVTTMFMNEKMDEGDILLKEEVEIEENDNSGTLFEKLSNIGSKLLLETMERIDSDDIERKMQIGEISYAPLITRELSKIDFNMKACEINNLVRGLNPFMCCYTVIKDKRYKIWKSREVVYDEIKDLEEKLPIKNITEDIFILDNRLFARTSTNFLEILEIQEEGRKRLKTLEYLRGERVLNDEKQKNKRKKLDFSTFLT